METTQILLIIASIFLSVGWFGFRKMCPNCHRWNGLKRINSDHERDETRYRTETVSTTKKNEYGRVTGTFEKQESVPYNVSFYKVTYRCKSCKQQIQRTMRNGKYLKEAVILFIICLIIFFIAFNPEINSIEPNIENSPKNQNSINNDLQNSPNPKDSKISKIPSKTASLKKSQPQPLPNTHEKPTNIESSQKELGNARNNEKQSEEQAISKQIIITEETPNNFKRELAIKMLTQGKKINEIADSTFLTKKEIRKLKRTINKK